MADEMVKVPAPVMPKLTQGKEESNLDFSMRKRKAKKEYIAARQAWENSDGMAPAAAPEAEASEEVSRFDRKAQLDKALGDEY